VVRRNVIYTHVLGLHHIHDTYVVVTHVHTRGLRTQGRNCVHGARDGTASPVQKPSFSIPSVHEPWGPLHQMKLPNSGEPGSRSSGPKKETVVRTKYGMQCRERPPAVCHLSSQLRLHVHAQGWPPRYASGDVISK
jgi:hypothetical protein